VVEEACMCILLSSRKTRARAVSDIVVDDPSALQVALAVLLQIPVEYVGCVGKRQCGAHDNNFSCLRPKRLLGKGSGQVSAAQLL
jgi:hypothetical protein